MRRQVTRPAYPIDSPWILDAPDKGLAAHYGLGAGGAERQLRQFVAGFAPDVIHAHMFHALVAAFAATRLNGGKVPKICFTSHNQTQLNARSRILRGLKHWRDADVVFSSRQQPDINTARTVLIPNGVPVQTPPPARQAWIEGGPVTLLAVGRLCADKDPLGLIRSLAALNHPQVTLEFLGIGPLEAEARTLASALGLQHRIRFSGLCTDVPARLRAADIFVMHSLDEGMPLALLEAGAAAMPVVSTPVGAIPDVLGRDRGWLTTADRFANTLAQVIRQPDAAIAAGVRLHAHVCQHHSIEAVTEQHQRLYESV